VALSQPLGDSYAQFKTDLDNPERISWAGTAHEVREVLRGMLDLLAPDEAVMAEPWYRQDKSTSGPTQKQRVKYVIKQRQATTNESKVVEQAGHLEEMIGEVVRSTYSRASDAAHRRKNRREVARIVNYFEAFAHDLLDLD
jgi:Predicted pPIWI-associating nuclease